MLDLHEKFKLYDFILFNINTFAFSIKTFVQGAATSSASQARPAFA